MTTPIPESHLDILENKSLAPRVSLSLCDPDNPYRYLEIRGEVVDISEDGADAHIDQLAHKCLGVNEYPHRRAEEVRVIYKIAPQRFTRMG